MTVVNKLKQCFNCMNNQFSSRKQCSTCNVTDIINEAINTIQTLEEEKTNDENQNQPESN